MNFSVYYYSTEKILTRPHVNLEGGRVGGGGHGRLEENASDIGRGRTERRAALCI